VGVLDLVTAKCLYAKARSCVCAEIHDRGVLDLHDARHPLLIELFDAEATAGGPKRDVVPIDVRVGDDFDVLVITGPNTGGKTVTLKTVGLLALMNQCGLPIPVRAGSRMPVYGQIFIDVGDEQSLQQSLSTFSSHLATLLEILQASGSRSLVLIDELGAGTDPDEGAAIGQAVVSELLRLRAKAVVTTHLSTLKAIAFTTPRVDNAAVEFDPQSSRRDAERARREARDAELKAVRDREQYERQRERFEESKRAFDEWTKWVNALEAGEPVYIKSLRQPAKVVRMELHRQRALVSTGTVDIEVPLRDIDRPAAEA
jgi:dsDNA-specific endonuclease/ATPase MutS2